MPLLTSRGWIITNSLNFFHLANRIDVYNMMLLITERRVIRPTLSLTLYNGRKVLDDHRSLVVYQLDVRPFSKRLANHF